MEELDLSHLSIRETIPLLKGKIGVYVIKNKINGKMLIGSGNLGNTPGHANSRILDHLTKLKMKIHRNKDFQNDYYLYGEKNIILDHIVVLSNKIDCLKLEYELIEKYSLNIYNKNRNLFYSKQLFEQYNILDLILKDTTKLDCGCWQYRKNNKNKYSIIYSKHLKYHYLIHRIMYTLFKGEFLSYMQICHTCNQKFCINPNHLYLGTPEENSKQAVKDGLFRTKFQDMTIPTKIRELYLQGYSPTDIREYLSTTDICIDKNTIRNIIYNRTYKDNNYVFQNRPKNHKSFKNLKYGFFGVDKSVGTKYWRVIVPSRLKIGVYHTIEDAAKIRDYYFHHNNIKTKFNFPEIDYNLFMPPKMRNGKYHPEIQKILDKIKKLRSVSYCCHYTYENVVLCA